jgi:hypothetical protein
MVLTKESKEEPPTFLSKPIIREEDDGNKLVFECKLLCNPSPEVSWYRGETLIETDIRTQSFVQEFDPHKYFVSLEIDDVVETDCGIYKVHVKNIHGHVSASISLNFTRKSYMIDHLTFLHDIYFL